MSGVLQYTLGLNAAAFVSGMNQAQSRLAAATAKMRTEFISVAAAIAPVAAAVRSSFRFGSDISDLALRTGETASTILTLRQAFTEAGIGAEMTGQALDMMRRALGGVNEDGQPTAKVFERLGLSVAQLRSQGAVDQLRLIGAAISRLGSQSEQAAATMQIFGRGGGRMLQLFRDPAALDNAAKAVGRLGPYMDKNAATFDRVDDAMSRLRLRWQEFAAGIAEKLIPLFDRLSAALGNADFIRMGNQVGTVLAQIAGRIAGIVRVVSQALGGPAGVAALVAKLIELRLILSGLRMAGGLFDMGAGAIQMLAGAGAKIGAGAAAHLAGPAAALIGAAIAAKIVADIIEARSKGVMDNVIGSANDRAARMADFRKRAGAMSSAGDWEKLRGDINAEMEAVNAELAGAREEWAKGSLIPGVKKMLLARLQMLESDRHALDSMFAAFDRQRGEIIARNADAADRAAAEARRREQTEIAGRAQSAYAKMRFDPRERRADETDEEFARRSLKWTQDRIAAIEAETEAIRRRINAQQAAADDAERVAALADEYVTLRREAVGLQLQLQRQREPEPKTEPAPRRTALDETPPRPASDRLARVGGFVGGVTTDLARRQMVAAERTVRLLERLVNRRETAPTAAYA